MIFFLSFYDDLISQTYTKFVPNFIFSRSEVQSLWNLVNKKAPVLTDALVLYNGFDKTYYQSKYKFYDLNY